MAGNGWPRCLRPLSNGLSWRIRCGDLKEMALEKRIFIRAFFDEGGEPLLAFASGFRYYPKKTAAGILASGDRWMNVVFPVFLERFRQWAKKWRRILSRCRVYRP